jgi:N-methylhydantoinase B/oxoprolinase/acetone carboxylase alpha subunit
MAGLTVNTAETEYAITSAEVKNWLRIDGSDDDTVITLLTKTAHNWAKRYTARSLTTQTLTLSIDSIYDTDIPLEDGMYTGIDIDITRRSILLPESPVASITSVKYYDDADTESTFTSSKYYLDKAGVPARFVLRQGESYPTGLRVANALEIKYVAGYGGSSDVPEDIKQACLLYTAYLFEQRGDGEKNLNPPHSATQLLQAYRIRQLSTNPYRGTAHYGGMV